MLLRKGYPNRKVVSRPLAVFLSMLVLSLSIYSCAGMSPQTKSTLTCGVAGGLLGAVIGAAVDSKNRGRGALIGAAIGAIGAMGACFAVSAYKNTEVADYEATTQQVDYVPTSGDVMRITEFNVEPQAVKPGEQIAFNAQYYVMTPDPNQEITVVETRTIRAYDEETQSYNELGSTTNEITMKPGTRKGDGELDIHPLTPSGNYQLAFTVQYLGKTAVAEQPLTIGDAPVVAANEPAPGSKAADTSVTVPAASGDTNRYFVVVVETTTLRSGSGATFNILAQLKQGQQYLIIESVDNRSENVTWHRIKLDDGREGWVSGASGKVEQR